MYRVATGLSSFHVNIPDPGSSRSPNYQTTVATTYPSASHPFSYMTHQAITDDAALPKDALDRGLFFR